LIIRWENQAKYVTYPLFLILIILHEKVEQNAIRGYILDYPLIYHFLRMLLWRLYYKALLEI